MHVALFVLLILALLFGPQLWTRYTFRRYSAHRDDIPGTGGELAEHLVRRFALIGIRVVETDRGDHYDPTTRTIGLSPGVYRGHSLTAVAVAAHEVGHAIQHYRREPLFALRSRLVELARTAQQGGAVVMLAVPLVAVLTRAPASGALLFGLALLSLGSAALVHLATLPLEWDASFGKAMPILKQGRYVSGEDEKVVRRILRAAALTYVAGALASLLNVGRWWRLVRR